jgi:hypothetical protein
VQMEQVTEEEENLSFHSCEGKLLLHSPLFFFCVILKKENRKPRFLQGPKSTSCRRTRRWLRPRESCHGNSSPVTGTASRGRVFLGEHWGGTGLGEHWGPSRQRYLQGPWCPHPEELDRCVTDFLLFLCLHSVPEFQALSLPLLSILLISLSFI